MYTPQWDEIQDYQFGSHHGLDLLFCWLNLQKECAAATN